MNPLWLAQTHTFAQEGASADFHPESTSVFSALDYVALALFLIGSLAVGIAAGFFGKKDSDGHTKETDTEEFLMGSRQLSLLPVALSLLVSFNSAIVTLGGPAEIYFNGTMYIWSMLGELLAAILASVLFVPVLYNLTLTSSFEYLEMRFKSRLVRITGNILLLLNNVIYMGIALYAPATALSYVTNNAISTEVSIIVSGLICTAYTTWGGIKAVIWTDVFQSIIMMAGVVAIIIRGLIDIGGFGVMWSTAEKHGRIEFDNFNPDPRERHTFWGLIIANAIAYSSTFGVTQASVQRYCGLTSVRKAQISVVLACSSASLFVLTTSLCGLIIFAFYAIVACDPAASGRISDDNQLVPYFVMERLSVPFVPGLFVASLFAGALSSVSSSLSALSATTWQDLLKPYLFKDASETKATWINRISVVIFGGLAIGMGVLSVGFGGTVLEASLTFTGSFGAPILGLFSLGILLPYVDKYGALVGSVIGLAVSAWISIGSYIHGKQLVGLPTNTSGCEAPNANLTTVLTTMKPTEEPVLFDDWYSISYVWYTLIGAAATMLPAMIVSLFTGGRHQQTEDRLLNPYVMRFYRFVGGLCPCGGKTVVHPVDESVELKEADGGKAVKASGDDEENLSEQKPARDAVELKTHDGEASATEGDRLPPSSEESNVNDVDEVVGDSTNQRENAAAESAAAENEEPATAASAAAAASQEEAAVELRNRLSSE